MKILKKVAALAALAALAPAIAQAGDPKAPLIEDPICAVPFTGSVSVGYETTYLFRGVDFGDDAPWGAIDLNYVLGSNLDLDLGAWYINPTQNPTGFDELDLYGFLNFPLGFLDASVGGTWFYFPEPGGSTGEVSLGLGYDFGIAELGFFTAYDFDGEGFYFDLGAGKTIPLGACLDLGLGAGISYVDDYFGTNGWNHAYATASLILHMTESAALTGYVGGNFPLEAIDATEDDDLHGGVSVSVSF